MIYLENKVETLCWNDKKGQGNRLGNRCGRGSLERTIHRDVDGRGEEGTRDRRGGKETQGNVVEEGTRGLGQRDRGVSTRARRCSALSPDPARRLEGHECRADPTRTREQTRRAQNAVRRARATHSRRHTRQVDQRRRQVSRKPQNLNREYNPP